MKKALNEQKELRLPWYTATSGVIRASQDKPVAEWFKNVFVSHWSLHCAQQSKLEFYGSVETEFKSGIKDYLMVVKDVVNHSTLTKIRISVHNLAIENGRYTKTERSERFFFNL